MTRSTAIVRRKTFAKDSECENEIPKPYAEMHGAIVALLETARRAAVRRINSLMTATYWEIGRRVVEYEQGGRSRAVYGEVLLERLARDLTMRFGRGFGARNLTQMRAFYLVWSGPKIPQTVSAESRDLDLIAARFPLPWSAYVQLLSIRSEAARSFYEAEALRCGWTVRQLVRQIDSQFYERTCMSKHKSAMLAEGGHVSPADGTTPEEAIKDPFVLEFLDLKDQYSESDLDEALIGHLADFLLELGDDFAFIGRQRALRLDDKWFRVDLLFYHRRLKCLLVIDLKSGRFSHADAGQMHLYLNFAREHWMKPGENPPVGLILCASKGTAEARYALEGLPNKVLASEYRTVLPDEKVIAGELERSRQALQRRQPKKQN